MAGQEVERRREWPDWPDVFGRWFSDWPRWPSLRSVVESTLEGAEPMRIEETVEGDQLVIRAELPGIDPDKDVEISVQDRTLHIRAERRQETKEEAGPPPQRVPLRQLRPSNSGAQRRVSEEQVTASYQDGILEVQVPLPPEKPAEAAKRIQVRRT